MMRAGIVIILSLIDKPNCEAQSGADDVEFSSSNPGHALPKPKFLAALTILAARSPGA